MARKPITDMSAWPSLSLEGNLIAPAMIAKIDQRQAPKQSPEEYSVRKGLQIREEIATAFRVGQSHFDDFSKIEHPSAAATSRFVAEFFRETFGYTDLAPSPVPIALRVSNRVPFVVVPPNEKLDGRSPTLSTDRSRSPAFALQDYLNDRDEALWGIVTNGMQLRLMRDNAALTRPAYIEADLTQMFTNEDIASFAVLWLLIHRSRFGATDTPATDCALESWRDAGFKEGEVARDRLAGQVQLALKLLGSGFLEANPDLAAKLCSGEVNLTEWFNELLRLVYRLIFLMVAEDRNLLHPEKAKPEARNLYAQGYSLQSLRKQCYRAATWDKHHDRYEAVKIVFRALTHGQTALALPALGGLFAEDRLPHLETAQLRNRSFMEALYRLSWLCDKNGMVPVNWRAMETEELGSVYETLLELQPRLGDDGKTLIFASETAEQKGNQRKTTGSYYTPDSLVQALLDTALDPVLDKIESEADDPAKALLKLSVIDPACGSGHFLLAAARRVATRLARIRAEGTPSLADFRHAVRDVARCCIHGVDRNPMAVELTKVALWIETVDPGLPLGFFDAQIRCGDALLGVFDLKVLEEGIPDAAYKPLTGDDKDVAKFYGRANKDAKKGQGTFDFIGGRSDLPTVPLSIKFSDLRDLPEDSVADVEVKAKAYRSLRKHDAFLRACKGCDLYTAAFLLPKTGEVPRGDSERIVPTSEDVWLATGQGRIREQVVERANAAIRDCALHWPLEFPDVMAEGGFDVVLGNPPWEVMQLSDKEYFATRNPEIAELIGARRKKAINALAEVAPKAHKKFVETRHLSEAINNFVRVSGRFDRTAQGKINTYALFAELFLGLVGPKGRAGVIVPTGIATDATTAPFFAHLVERKRLARIVDFENSSPIFPSVHRSFKFCLLTLGRNESEAHFAFFLTETAQMAKPERNFVLSPDQISAINPNTRTAPVFRSRKDAELTAKIYRTAPVLIEEGDGLSSNIWGIKFRQGLFNMTSDSGFFRTAVDLEQEGFVRSGTDWIADGAQPLQKDLPVDMSGLDRLEFKVGSSQRSTRYVPLYEAKMIHQFDHRWASYDAKGETSSEVKDEQKATPELEPFPRYWVPDDEVTARLDANGWRRGWLMGWRDITNATNERTVIFSIFPKAGVGHTSPLIFVTEEPNKKVCLLANLSSLTLDFIARQAIGGTHLTYGYLKQFALLPPTFYTEPRLEFVTPRVLELTYTSHSLASFAEDLGYNGPPFAWNEERRANLRAELDAFYARAYGLCRDELRYILDPQDVMGEEYPSKTFYVLKKNELRRHGEYRTRRLVLEAWDRMEQDGTFAALGMTDGASAVVQQTQLPPLDQYQDAVWAWPLGINERDRVRAQLRAMVGILPGPSDVRRVRLATLACLQPGLLDGFLSDSDRREWQRLMAHSTSVPLLVPPTNVVWGAAFNDLVSSAVLDVLSDGAQWGAGLKLDRSTLNVNDPAVGRAIFAWSRLEGVDLDHGLARVSAEILPFIREGYFAA